MSVEIITPIVNVVDFDKIISEKTTETPSAYVMEYVCRVCYNSYDKIKADSYIKLLSDAAKRGHRSIFDFSNVQFVFHINDHQTFISLDHFFESEKYLNHEAYTLNSNSNAIMVTGSIRSFIELLERYTYLSFEYTFVFSQIFSALYDNYEYIITNWPSCPELLNFYNKIVGECDYNERILFTDIIDKVNVKQDKIHRKILVELTTDRGLHNELVRHRPAEHMAESQRYVRYGTDKNPLKICIDSKRFSDEDYVTILKESSEVCYGAYKKLLDGKYAPQVARATLPMGTALKSFIYCNMEEWEHVVRLRYAKDALPMAQEVTGEIFKQMVNKKLF